MGGRPGACKTASHECNHDVHVRQLPTDFQYHDGFHVVQKPYTRAVTDESNVRKIRDPEDEEQDVGCQGSLCPHESCGFGAGHLEGQWHGLATVRSNHTVRRGFIGLLANSTYRTTRSDWLAWETQREPLERAILTF